LVTWAYSCPSSRNTSSRSGSYAPWADEMGYVRRKDVRMEGLVATLSLFCGFAKYNQGTC
jgi:hypothetical protein